MLNTDNALNLRPGVALSAAQAAQLTSDIVVLEATTVTLANGQTAQVLKPQVYLKPRTGDLQANGDLMAAQNLNLQVSGDVVTSGGMGARQVLSVSANNIRNVGGSLNAQSANLQATQDIVVEGGQISATDQLSLQAGRDIALTTTTGTSSNPQGGRTYTDRVASLYVSAAAGQLLVNAARDASLQGAQVINQGAGGQTTLSAGRNLALGTVQTSERNDIVWNSQNQRHDATSQDVGSSVQTKGNVTLQAGQDLGVRASTVQSDSGALTATAAGQVRIEAGQTQQTVDETHQSSSKSLLSSKTTTKRDTADNTLSQGSTLSATSVGVNAGQSIAVQGSSVVSDSGTTLNAQGNVTVEAAQDRLNSTHTVSTRQSGVMGTGGGVGVSIGSRSHVEDTQQQGTTASASTVGATAGKVQINAGQRYSQSGSDVLSPQGSVDITAQKVDITHAQESQQTTTQVRDKQSGLTLSVNNPVVNAAQTARQMNKAGSQTQDSRMKALSKLTTALAANSAAGDVLKDPATAGGVNISIMAGNSRSQSTTTQTSQTARASQVAAGQDISITATGAQDQSDVTIQGSDVKAGGNVALSAQHDVNLQAAQQTATQKSTDSSSSAALGIGIQLNSERKGLTFNASASQARGKADGQDTVWRNTQVQAGQHLSINSGADTTLKGAVTKGEQVTANVGGNLQVQSLQDTSDFDSKRRSSGAGVTICVPPFCSGTSSVSVSQAKTDIHSTYASVAEQSGIQAGAQGFQITVNGATVLTGAVIASTDKAVQDGKNSITTGSLSLSDIQNKADYKATAYSVSVGTDKGQTSAGIGQDSGHASSTTTAGVSGIAGDKAVRTGDAQQGIAKIFDQAQVSKEVGAQVAITQAFGQQAAKAVGDYAGKQEQSLKQQAQAAKQAGDNELAASLKADADKWAEGGTYRVAMHTVVGGLGGGLAGAAGAGASAAAAPSLEDLQARLQNGLEQAGLNTSVAKGLASLASGATATAIGSALGGGVGAAAGLNEDANNRQLHPTEIKWIKDNAKRYAALRGISPQEAEKHLSEQAFRQVQFGAEGGAAAWDANAQAFLKSAGTQALPNGGYMFYATPDQRADATMYLDSAIKNADFYAKNGLKQPTLADLQSAAQRDAGIRANLSAATKTALAASATLNLVALAPTTLGWALAHPVEASTAGIISAETAAAITSGAVTPTSLAPMLSVGGMKAVTTMGEAVSGPAAKATAGGYIKAAKVCEAGCAITGLSQSEQALVAQIQARQDGSGKLTEQLLESVASRTGSTVLSGGKYGGNNGFDLVLKNADGTVTVVMDGKQMLQSGAFSLREGLNNSFAGRLEA